MRAGLAAFAVFACLAPSARAEEVEHPAYKSWARHPVGTTISTRSVTESPAGKLTTTTTYKLLALKSDKAVLEIRRVSDATGSLEGGPPQIYEQPRMFPLLPGVKKEQIGKPSNAQAQGEETVTLVGREIKAVWYDSKARGEAGETSTRTWMSDDIPNRLVKAVTKIPKASTTVTVELVEFKTP